MVLKNSAAASQPVSPMVSLTHLVKHNHLRIQLSNLLHTHGGVIKRCENKPTVDILGLMVSDQGVWTPHLSDLPDNCQLWRIHFYHHVHSCPSGSGLQVWPSRDPQVAPRLVSQDWGLPWKLGWRRICFWTPVSVGRIPLLACDWRGRERERDREIQRQRDLAGCYLELSLHVLS